MIRLATIADLDALLPLVQAYRVFYQREPDAQRERAFIEAHLRNGTSTIYIAEVEGKPVGFMQLFKTYSTVRLANSWILEDLFVMPESRGRGVASELLARALEHARADGACGMFLETAQDNVTAQRVYERAGWTREGHFLKYNAPLAWALELGPNGESCGHGSDDPISAQSARRTRRHEDSAPGDR